MPPKSDSDAVVDPVLNPPGEGTKPGEVGSAAAAAGIDEKVVMSHPDIPGAYGEPTRSAFETVWKAKGFVLVDPDKIDPTWRRPSTPSE